MWKMVGLSQGDNTHIITPVYCGHASVVVMAPRTPNPQSLSQAEASSSSLLFSCWPCKSTLWPIRITAIKYKKKRSITCLPQTPRPTLKSRSNLPGFGGSVLCGFSRLEKLPQTSVSFSVLVVFFSLGWSQSDENMFYILTQHTHYIRGVSGLNWLHNK